MKKIFVVILCLATIFFSITVAQAENAVSLWSEDVDTKNSRLFDLEVYVDCTFNLTAATFEISYDNTIMEYREVRTEITNSQVKATDTNGKVKAIFLKSDGISSNSKVKLFSAKFKAVSEGACNVESTMYDFVDNTATEIKGESSAQIKVTVAGSKSNAISRTEAKSKTDDKGKTGVLSSTEEAKDSQSTKYLSVVSPDDSDEYLFIILLLVLVIIGLMFYSSKLKKDKEKATPEPPETNPKNQDEPTENVNTKDKLPEKEPIEKEPTEEISSQATFE